MLEDGLEDIENLLTDLDKDSVGAKYLRMANNVSFSDICSFVIEFPVSANFSKEAFISY